MAALTVKETSLHLRNAYTRMPFRYGSACLTACPQAVLRVVVERNGRAQSGYSGDALPPGWFDKRPEVSYRQQIADQISMIDAARRAFAETNATFPDLWRHAYTNVHADARDRGLPALLASFGHSLMERAVVDALCRMDDVPFHRAAKDGLFGVAPETIAPELAGHSFVSWLPATPAQRIFIRHTVGLADPLTPEEVVEAERLHDGLPQSFQEYVERSGLRYFKIKVSNRLEHDLERLKRIVAIIEAVRGPNYAATLDGNEQYGAAEEFSALIERIRAAPALSTFWNNVIAVEQPLHRSIAMDSAHTAGIRELGESKPVIIDESDDALDSYPRALALGYRGVSSKACKGAIKSLVNAGLTWLRNDRGARNDCLITGEDLTCVGMAPLQTDLALVATLGLTHVERNGHHYYRGLSYLPESHQREIVAAHPDLYETIDGVACMRLRSGAAEIGSVHGQGFGFAIEPRLSDATPAEAWSFESLGLGDA